jgi:ribosomal peptide maturation radical SAM protein 1
MRKSTGKVLLISMPFAAIDRQALGLSLLQSALAGRGIACEIRYLNLSFAEMIGFDDYIWLLCDVPYTAFGGDWAFAEALFGEDAAAADRYVRQILQDLWRLEDHAVRRLLRIRGLTRPFLDHVIASISWSDYALVGFTSTFEQNIASLALARRLRSAFPHMTVAFGGGNWEDEMGLELHRQFPFVDVVCSGEAEESFPAVVTRCLSGESPGDVWSSIPGLVIRGRDGASLSTGPAPRIRDLDRLPVPDYHDYFQALSQSTVGSLVIPTLLFESARGCWWGAKHHCTFCGLNGGGLAFRSKSSSRVLKELDQLTGRWGIESIEVVDNILDMTYFHDVLPTLAQARRPWRLFYETKANLTRSQVRLLRDAGVSRIQPGLESLSDSLLRQMRKGTTALRNIQLLKWCAEDGIHVDWNILYGFPGETRADYEQTLRYLDAIRFLQPPSACGMLRLDRFSPYHQAPQLFGLRNLRPTASFRHLYPVPADALARMTYYFDYDYDPDHDPHGAATDVISYVQRWKERPETGTLTAHPQPDGSLLLRDTRSNRTVSDVRLQPMDRLIYDACDAIQDRAAVLRDLRSTFPEASIDPAQVWAFLDSLVANKLMVSDGARYLSLALQRSDTVGTTTRSTVRGVAASHPECF